MTPRTTGGSPFPRDRDDAADDLENAQELAELVHDALRLGTLGDRALSRNAVSGAATVIRMVAQRIARVREDLGEGGCLGRRH